MHAEIRIDDTVVMLADSVEDYPGVPVMLHVYVPDVDAVYRRALEAGGLSIQEPVQKSDSDRLGGFKDPAGNTWWIATHVEDVTWDEAKRRVEALVDQSPDE